MNLSRDKFSLSLSERGKAPCNFGRHLSISGVSKIPFGSSLFEKAEFLEAGNGLDHQGFPSISDRSYKMKVINYHEGDSRVGDVESCWIQIFGVMSLCCWPVMNAVGLGICWIKWMSIIHGVDLEGITHRGDPCSHKRSIFACKSKIWHFQLLDRKNDDPHPSPK